MSSKVIVTRKFNLEKDLGVKYRYETIDFSFEGFESDLDRLFLLIEESYRAYIMKIREGKIR